MICIPVCLCMGELQSPTGCSTTKGAAITWSIFGKGTWNRTDCISRLQSLFLNYNADSHSERAERSEVDPKTNPEIKDGGHTTEF